MAAIRIGWSQGNLTPNRPVYIGGQIYPRISGYVHDPLTVTALALENGTDQAILLSLDIMCVPPRAITDRIREALRDLPGFDPKYLSISATHTHNSIQAEPYIFSADAIAYFSADRMYLPEKPSNLMEGDALNSFLVDCCVQTAREAWLNRAEGGIACASDYAAVAFNRRPIFRTAEGDRAEMYGVCAQKNFVRYEGSSDHSADMIYTFDQNQQLTGIAVCIPCPSQVFELHSFLTADYWHYTRQTLRERFGNVHILPLCGAAGDQNPLDLTRISKTNVQELRAWGAQAGPVFRNFDMADICRDIADRITDAVARGYKKARNRISTQPVFIHETAQLQLPIRQVSEADYREAVHVLDAEKATFSKEHPAKGADLVRIFEPMGVYSRYVQQNRCPYVDTPLHYWRLNDTVMASCPFELFVDYAFRVKARAASMHTVVVQMTDGYYDYLPTEQAIHGGSYSSAPASTTCGPESGNLLVEEMLQTIQRIWMA